jgi:AraC-like DNA-binding protein
MEVIFISGIFMSFFIALLLLTKKSKALPDKILAVWITFIGIHLLGFYFNQLGYWEEYPNLIGVTAPIPLFHGPLLYLYCLYALRGEQRVRRIDYLHFVPGVLAYLYMFNFFFFYSTAEKIMVDKGEVNDFNIFSIILLIAILFSGFAYVVFSYRLTIQYRNKIKDSFSFSEGISLKWLRYCIVCIGLLFILAIIVFFMRDGLNISFPFNPEYIFYFVLIIFIFYLGYFGIKHENIFVSKPLPESSTTAQKPAPEKYKNSGMKAELVEELYEKLLKFMEEKKPYLNPKLSLSELAHELDVSSNQLSQIINAQAKVNFHDFINTYRVDEFIQNAESNTRFSLLALALDAGFNSKSSFNYIFKKQKGVSPSQYLSGIKKQQ